MKTYKIVFSSQSVINEIPNSQTIFGAICNIILQTQGKEQFDEYINSFGTEAKMVHSSMFMNQTLPMIKKNVFSLDYINTLVNGVNPNEKLKMLEKAKQYKRIGYVSESIYNTYIENDKVNELTKDLQEKSEQFQIVDGILKYKKDELNSQFNSVLLTRNGFPEKDNDKTLFYTKAMYYPKGTEFCVYIKTNEDEDYLKSIFQYFEYFGVGSRRTIGDNAFKFERIENVEKDNLCLQKLILSRYIPNENEVDFEQSFYQLASNIYRASKGYAQGYVAGKFRHILEGSYMKVNENKDYYGKIIKTQANGKDVYHYAIGFVL